MRTLCRFGIIIWFAFAAATSLAAGKLDNDEIPSMDFFLVKSASKKCEPDCPTWIYAHGKLEPGTSARFAKFMKTLGKRAYPVVLNSPGGSVESAMEMGRLIRKRGLDVVVGATSFVGCLPRAKDCKLAKADKGIYRGSLISGAICNSACPFIFASGKTRLAGAYNHIGVHRITSFFSRDQVQYRLHYKIIKGQKKVVRKEIVSRKKGKLQSTTEMSKDLRKKLTTYFAEMGVKSEFLTFVTSTPASDIRRLTSSEMASVGLTTASGEPGEFVEAFRSDKSLQAGGLPAVQFFLPNENPKPEEPMRFAIVRNETGCQPLCPYWIYGFGRITPHTPQLLLNILALPAANHLPLVLSSTGGDVEAASQMAFIVSMRALDTAVGLTKLGSCVKSGKCLTTGATYNGIHLGFDSHCYGACVLVLAAGRQRYVGPSTYVNLYNIDPALAAAKNMVNYFFFAKDVPDDKKFHDALLTNLQKSSVDVAHPSLKYSRPQNDNDNLSIDQLLKSRIANKHDSADIFAAPIACTRQPAPVNCRSMTYGAFAENQLAQQASVDAAKGSEQIRQKERRLSAPASGPEQPMRFAMVRTAGKCDPKCPRWIAAEGRIVGETAMQFEDFLVKEPARGLPLILSSTGGDVDTAKVLAGLIKQHDLSVAVARTDARFCPPGKVCEPKSAYEQATATDEGGYCFGACMMLLASGKVRLAARGTHVSLARWEMGKPMTSAMVANLKPSPFSKPDPQLHGKLLSSLDAQLIDTRDVAFRIRIPGSEIVTLSVPELESSKLVSLPETVSLLTGADRCRKFAGSPNCL